VTTSPTPYWAPRFWPGHLLTLALVALAVWLGAWQWDAWQERRAAEARDLTQAAPLPLDSVLGPDQPFPGARIGQPVIVAGEWLDRGTVFVERDTGYWVVTPLAVGGAGEPAIPVVRGVAETPRAPALTGYAELVGWLQPPEGTGMIDPEPADDVLPQLRVADLVQRVDVDLYGGYAVVVDEVAAPGTWPGGGLAHNAGTEGLAPADLTELPESGRFTAFRNVLYALEWWVFGGFALFVWLRYLLDTRAAERAPANPIASAP
jgi:cytochrome oxidase assembly protein ShyY1